MSEIINLDRAVPLIIKYPLGVKETITITFNDEVTLTDTFQIVIADKSGTIIETIVEADTEFTKSTNKLSWLINYEDGGLLDLRNYDFEIQNTTKDYRVFTGEIRVKNTL